MREQPRFCLRRETQSSSRGHRFLSWFARALSRCPDALPGYTPPRRKCQLEVFISVVQ